MPMMAAPQERKSSDSARVENCGPLDHHACAADVRSSLIRRGLPHRVAQDWAIWVREGDVGDDAFVEECPGPATGPVDQLVRHDHVQRPDPLLQAADGADGYDTLDAQGLQCVDVGPRRKIARGDLVAPSMPRKKGNPLA